MQEKAPRYTEEELNEMFGFTPESLEKECEIYERDAWEIGSGDRLFIMAEDGSKEEIPLAEILQDCKDIDTGKMKTKPLREVLKAYGMDV